MSERPTSQPKKIEIQQSQIGVIGDHARVEGGIHFHSLPTTPLPSLEERVDFVIVTALEEELEAVLGKLPDFRRQEPTEEDILISYYMAQVPITFPDGSLGAYTVVVIPPLGMGRVGAMAAISDAIRKWVPRYIILVGIAGGLAESGVELGDILVSDQIVDYELQRLTSDGPHVRWEVFRTDARMVLAARNFRVGSWQALMAVDRPGSGIPTCHIGPILSGDKVIAFERMLKQYRHIWPKLIGVEMESAGVVTAAQQAVSQPGVLMVRGVSDLVDEKKRASEVTQWRAYACDVAAAYTIGFLKSGPVPTREALESGTFDLSGDFRQATVYIKSAIQGRAVQSVIPLQRPPRAEHFTGRERELAQLLADLRPGHVVTLCGPGGVGKTALAVEAVWTLAPGHGPPERFPDGILFHSFYGRPDPALALEHIALSFGAEPRPTPAEAALRVLSGKCALLILDGAEQAADLGAVLEVRGGCGVLVTSRARQDALAGWLDIQPLDPGDALDLLRKWGGDRAADAHAARQICELVGHLPLAVRLAGRYLAQSGESAADYLEWLRETPLDALDHGQRRQESVRVLLDKSLAQVSDTARQVLAIVGLLALAPVGCEPLAAALDVPASQLRRLLGELVNCALLSFDGERYQVSHTSVQTYARQCCQPTSEVADRLAEYYATLAEAESAKGLEGYYRLDGERAHLMRVLQVCNEKELWEAARALVWAVDDYLDLRGYWTERAQALELGIKAARASESRYDEGAFLASLAHTQHSLGQARKGIELGEQALAIWRKIGDCRGEGAVLGNLGLAYADLGQIEQAIDYYTQALAIAREIGDRRGESAGLGNLGLAYADLGQMEQAIEHYTQALAIAREIGDRRGEGAHLGNLGMAYADLGQVEKAIEHYTQALAIARGIGDRRADGSILGNLGLAYADLGQVEEAIAHYTQALAIACEIRDRQNEGNWLGNLGLAYADLGQVDKAIDYYTQALAIAREIGGRQNEGNWLGNLGNAYRDLGQAERAVEYYQQALAIAREIEDRRGEGNRLGNLGAACYRLGQLERANEYYQQALAISREIGDRRGEGSHLGNLGNAYAALGQVERAVEYYQQALAIAREIGDRRNEGIWLSNLGNAYGALGQVDLAIECYQKALAISREIGDRRSEGNHLGNLGIAYADLEQMEQAIECHQQALAIAREIGDRASESNCLGNLGVVYNRLGQKETALCCYEQALAIARDMGDRRGEINQLTNLGNYYNSLDHTEKAIEYRTLALGISREIGDRNGEIDTLRSIAALYQASNNTSQSINFYQQLVDIYHETKDLSMAAETLIFVGKLARENRQLDLARESWLKSRDIYSQLQSPIVASVNALLDELGSVVRTPVSLTEIVGNFFESAGFALKPTDEEKTFLCQPRDRVWQRQFSQSVILTTVSGEPLDGERVRTLHESFKQKYGDITVIFVVVDCTPAPSGWSQIGTLRFEGVQLVPIDDTVLFEGQEKRRQQQVLEGHLRRFLGQEEDLYNIRHPVADRMSFFGRVALANELINHLVEGRPLALFGLRKMGKSSLLVHLRDNLSFPTALVDLQTNVKLGDLYERILVSWDRSIRVKIGDLDWAPPSLIGAHDLSSAFVAATRQLLILLEHRNVLPRLCLLVDEADLMVPRGEKGLDRYLAIARTLRGLVQEEQGRFSLLMAGVDPLFNRMNRLAGQQNPFYQFFREIYLPSLERDDCVEMTRNIGQQMGLAYSDEALAFVADVSGGHPFLARQLCSLAFQQLGRHGDVPLSHLQEVVSRFVREPGTSELVDEHGLWGEISNPDLWPQPQVIENQAVLKSLAETEPQPEVKLVDQARDRRACERSLDELEKRAVLGKPDQSLYDIHLRLFRHWIRRYQLGLE